MSDELPGVKTREDESATMSVACRASVHSLRLEGCEPVGRPLIHEARTMSDGFMNVNDAISSEDDSASYMSADEHLPSHSSSGGTLLSKARRHAQHLLLERALLARQELPKTGRALVERLKALAAFAAARSIDTSPSAEIWAGTLQHITSILSKIHDETDLSRLAMIVKSVEELFGSASPTVSAMTGLPPPPPPVRVPLVGEQLMHNANMMAIANLVEDGHPANIVITPSPGSSVFATEQPPAASPVSESESSPTSKEVEAFVGFADALSSIQTLSDSILTSPGPFKKRPINSNPLGAASRHLDRKPSCDKNSIVVGRCDKLRVQAMSDAELLSMSPTRCGSRRDSRRGSRGGSCHHSPSVDVSPPRTDVAKVGETRGIAASPQRCTTPIKDDPSVVAAACHTSAEASRMPDAAIRAELDDVGCLPPLRLELRAGMSRRAPRCLVQPETE